MRRTITGIAVAVVVSVMTAASSTAEQPEQQAEKIAFGGPRGTNVTIKRGAENFVVTVEMTPVACFDGPTNAGVNRTKAQRFALNGFCRSSFGKARKLMTDSLGSDASEAMFRGVTIQDAGLQGGKYVLQLVIPENGIQPPPPKPVAPKPFARSSPLFTRYGDYEETIDALVRTLNAELARVMDELATAKADKSVIEEAVDKSGAAGIGQFEKLRAAIKGDNLLFDTTERPELLDKVDAAEASWKKKIESTRNALSGQK